MNDEERKAEALALWQQAYECQMRGELDRAIELYKRSLEVYPTAEAHTFLGWTYSFLGRIDEAIAECLKAIEVDPDFGNPYNDIGAYLIEKGQLDAAIPWLEKAKRAPRYEARCYPYVNLGRIYEMKGKWQEAAREYRQALEIEPRYRAAYLALKRVESLLN
ncbi:MAG TPA: tetratricopeptide repeat protein [Blastocatellia bacterium]|nr:tetratricopeptide repeat protein [Blastocatellia bacterium]